MPPRKKGNQVLGKAVKYLALAFPASSQGFPALPLDILFEIFSYLHPLDLLRLARTTKPFRRFLLNRANVAIWRSAFDNNAREGGPPACPSYMAEPAWARVAFEKTCHICFATLREDPGVDSVWWEFGTRYCGDCMGSQVTSTVSVKLKRLDPQRSDWETNFPRVPRLRYGQRLSWYYLVAHQREMIDAFIETEDEELRAAIVESRAEQTRVVMQHSKLCRDWAEQQIKHRREQAHTRQVEAENRRRANELKQQATKEVRLQAIVAKLKTLGWADEPWMAGGTLAQQIRYHPSVDVPKPLAPRAYRELEPALLLRLTAAKHTETLKQRLRVFRTTLPLIIDKTELENPAFSVTPRLVDILLIPAVRKVLEQEGDAPLSPEQLISTLRPIMPALLETWVGEAETQIATHARKLLNLEGENAPADPLTLAIAYVNCPQPCGTAGYFSRLSKHSCTSSWSHLPWSWHHGNDADSYEVLAENCTLEKPFTPIILNFGGALHGLEGVVRAYGRDPKTATVKEMAGERRLVTCSLCLTQQRHVSEESLAMDWLAAMNHCTKTHLRQRDPEIRWKFTGKQRDSDVEV
ncbi:hypothetical protein FB451DRAFT_1376335 [Mycena latifolia]|nr:hypothetical protein FB451DRAFT_1376335 [Mycena latifolia]